MPLEMYFQVYHLRPIRFWEEIFPSTINLKFCMKVLIPTLLMEILTAFHTFINKCMQIYTRYVHSIVITIITCNNSFIIRKLFFFCGENVTLLHAIERYLYKPFPISIHYGIFDVETWELLLNLQTLLRDFTTFFYMESLHVKLAKLPHNAIKLLHTNSWTNSMSFWISLLVAFRAH